MEFKSAEIPFDFEIGEKSAISAKVKSLQKKVKDHNAKNPSTELLMECWQQYSEEVLVHIEHLRVR